MITQSKYESIFGGSLEIAVNSSSKVIFYLSISDKVNVFQKRKLVNMNCLLFNGNQRVPFPIETAYVSVDSKLSILPLGSLLRVMAFHQHFSHIQCYSFRYINSVAKCTELTLEAGPGPWRKCQAGFSFAWPSIRFFFQNVDRMVIPKGRVALHVHIYA